MACAKRTNAARSKRPRRKSTLSKKDLSKRYIDAYDENAPVDDDEAPFNVDKNAPPDDEDVTAADELAAEAEAPTEHAPEPEETPDARPVELSAAEVAADELAADPLQPGEIRRASPRVHQLMLQEGLNKGAKLSPKASQARSTKAEKHWRYRKKMQEIGASINIISTEAVKFEGFGQWVRRQDDGKDGAIAVFQCEEAFLSSSALARYWAHPMMLRALKEACPEYAPVLDDVAVWRANGSGAKFGFEAPTIYSPYDGEPVRLVVDHTWSKDGKTYYVHGLLEQPINRAVAVVRRAMHLGIAY